MSYREYQQKRQARTAYKTKYDQFMGSLPNRVRNAIRQREDKTAAVRNRVGHHKIQAEEVLLILENYDVEVTEELFNTIEELFKDV